MTAPSKSTSNSDQRDYRSWCPIARALDLLGDKWSLLILRDALFFQVKTYAGFSQQPERVPSNLLASRLKRLVAWGFLEKVAYQQRPVRYHYVPTERARDLVPLLKGLRDFGETHLGGRVQGRESDTSEAGQ